MKWDRGCTYKLCVVCISRHSNRHKSCVTFPIEYRTRGLHGFISTCRAFPPSVHGLPPQRQRQHLQQQPKSKPSRATTSTSLLDMKSIGRSRLYLFNNKCTVQTTSPLAHAPAAVGASSTATPPPGAPPLFRPVPSAPSLTTPKTTPARSYLARKASPVPTHLLCVSPVGNRTRLPTLPAQPS
jgi:hypothetical protein